MRYCIDMLCDTQTEIAVSRTESAWKIAKPLLKPFRMRLRDAWDVIRGKQTAVEFYEDILKRNQKGKK